MDIIIIIIDHIKKIVLAILFNFLPIKFKLKEFS